MPLDLFAAADPATLTGYVRAALADMERNRFRLAELLPTRTIDDIEYRFYSGGAGLVDAATFRAYDSESPIGARRGAVRVSGELPPISRKVRMGEYDRLRLRNVGDDRLRNETLNDALAMTQSVAARIELARSEVLRTGSLTLNENGVVATVSYGRSGGNTFSASPLWTGNPTTAHPITDLQSATGLIAAVGGNATAIVMNDATYALFIATDQVKNLAWSGVAPSIVSDTAVAQILSAYSLPPIIRYNAVVNVAGSATKIVPDNKVIIVDANQLGSVLSGVTAEQLELTDTIGTAEPGIVAVATKTFDPVSVWTKAAAIALPVLANPDLSVGMTV